MERKKIVSSLIYKFIERLAVKGVGLIIGIILARLLLPEEFGQVAIISIFINLANAIIQNGFNSALIQQKKVDDKDYSTVFYITMLLSAMIVVILYITSPYIAAYYELPDLVWPIRVYSFSLFFGSFNSIQVAKMQRELHFESMMYTSLAATILSGVLGVGMAYMNFGIWALVGYGCSNIIFSCVAMLSVEKWFPKFAFSWKRASVLFSFGWKMLVSGILCSVYNDIRSLLIGKHYSIDDLAYYNRGQQYPEVISSTIDSAIQSVMFPAMSRSQSDPTQMRTMLKRTISLSVFILSPTLIGLAAAAPSVILLLLTEKWLPSVIYMQLICFGGMTYPFMSSSLVAIKALGRSDIYMKLEIVRRIIMFMILFIAFFFFDSVFAIAISYVVSMFIDMFVASAPLKQLLDYNGFKQVGDNWRTIIAALLMGFCVYFIGFLSLPLPLLFIIQVFGGIIVYIFWCFIFKVDSLTYLLSFFRYCRV